MINTPYGMDIIPEGKITLERTTGDISFDRCDAAELFVNTSTGDVLGTLLTPKIFIAKTTTGKIELPDTTTGGICKITTTTGDIIIDIAE